MTIGYGYRSFDGETQDDACEVGAAVGNATVDNSAGRQQTGAYNLLLPYGSAATGRYFEPILTLSAFKRILAFHGACSSSVSFTTEAPLIATLAPGGPVYAKIGTDGKIRIYDKNGTQRGPASTTLIPTSGQQEWHIIFDGLSLSTVWVVIYFDATEELAFDTGLSWTDFFKTTGSANEKALVWGSPESTNYGASLFLDDLQVGTSDASGDAPHLVNHPRPRGNGSMQTPPDNEGATNDWDTYSGLNHPDFDENVDELGGHDSGATMVGTETKNLDQLFTTDGANPVPVGKTVLKVQAHAVARLTGADKLGFKWLTKLGGTTVEQTLGGWTSASYEGKKEGELARPGGGPWVRGDFDPGDIDHGGRSYNEVAVTTGFEVTLFPLPDVWYSEGDLPLSTMPVSAGRRRAPVQVC